MKTIPLAQFVTMANDTDVYSVDFDTDCAVDWAKDGVRVTNFETWAKYSEDAQLNGYGRHSRGYLWSASRDIQRQAYRICKANSVVVSEVPEVLKNLHDTFNFMFPQSKEQR